MCCYSLINCIVVWNYLKSVVTVTLTLLAFPGWKYIMLLHNLTLPNLLLIVTLTLTQCLRSRLFSVLFAAIHDPTHTYSNTLHSCWPCDSSSKGYRWLHFVQAYRADVAILPQLMSPG